MPTPLRNLFEQALVMYFEMENRRYVAGYRQRKSAKLQRYVDLFPEFLSMEERPEGGAIDIVELESARHATLKPEILVQIEQLLSADLQKEDAAASAPNKMHRILKVLHACVLLEQNPSDWLKTYQALTGITLDQPQKAHQDEAGGAAAVVLPQQSASFLSVAEAAGSALGKIVKDASSATVEFAKKCGQNDTLFEEAFSIWCRDAKFYFLQRAITPDLPEEASRAVSNFLEECVVQTRVLERELSDLRNNIGDEAIRNREVSASLQTTVEQQNTCILQHARQVELLNQQTAQLRAKLNHRDDEKKQDASSIARLKAENEALRTRVLETERAHETFIKDIEKKHDVRSAEVQQSTTSQIIQLKDVLSSAKLEISELRRQLSAEQADHGRLRREYEEEKTRAAALNQVYEAQLAITQNALDNQAILMAKLAELEQQKNTSDNKLHNMANFLLVEEHELKGDRHFRILCDLHRNSVLLPQIITKLDEISRHFVWSNTFLMTYLELDRQFHTLCLNSLLSDQKITLSPEELKQKAMDEWGKIKKEYSNVKTMSTALTAVSVQLKSKPAEQQSEAHMQDLRNRQDFCGYLAKLLDTLSMGLNVIIGKDNDFEQMLGRGYNKLYQRNIEWFRTHKTEDLKMIQEANRADAAAASRASQTFFADPRRPEQDGANARHSLPLAP